ncbi:hypothetical protein LTR37_000270 [Vermiconidia calcicola]|uniref:Uncharacterized protein n=1 Tax=Vermiconidia calcicola TaxID=1690605 RepID=A0ACC3NZD5_9PEZI|nr:hypothetical protein LTR37_000270 [Vermiconidia calcicola]
MSPATRLISPTVLIPLLFSLICSYVVIGGIVNYRKLRQFKGPPLAGISRAWLFYQEVHARSNKAQYAAIEKYGSPARIGPDLLITDDADLVRHMNAPGSRWTRGPWYEGVKLDPRLDSVFSTRDERVHADLKAREAGGYNGRDIDTLEPDIDARVVDMCELIKRSYNGVSMDIASITRFFTLDVLSTVAFGAPFGFLAENRDLWDYNKESGNFILILALVVQHRFFRWIFFRPWFQALMGPKPTDKTGMGPMLAFAQKHVAERYGRDRKVKKDMLGHFVNKGLSQLQCEVEAELQIVAGSDSTTTVLRCTLFLILGNPVAYMKLRAEIDANTGIISYPVIKYNEAQKLPYLVACIWEGMRLYPPLFGFKEKCSPPGGETVKGIFYPEGVKMAICDDAMCRNKAIFGDDANIFRPERWIEASEDTRKRFMRVVDSIFGSGRFLCLGRHIAMMELHKAFVEVREA